MQNERLYADWLVAADLLEEHGFDEQRHYLLERRKNGLRGDGWKAARRAGRIHPTRLLNVVASLAPDLRPVCPLCLCERMDDDGRCDLCETPGDRTGHGTLPQILDERFDWLRNLKREDLLAQPGIGRAIADAILRWRSLIFPDLERDDSE